MNSVQINNILRKHPKTRDKFLGVFARDELVNIKQYPCCFVMNTAKRSHPGMHWVAFFFDSNKVCHFFDSYGNSPTLFRLNNFIKNNSTRLIFNKKQIQSWTSDNCGYFCVLFLIFKCLGYSIGRFCKLFYDSSDKNDKIIEKLKIKF